MSVKQSDNSQIDGHQSLQVLLVTQQAEPTNTEDQLDCNSQTANHWFSMPKRKKKHIESMLLSTVIIKSTS